MEKTDKKEAEKPKESDKYCYVCKNNMDGNKTSVGNYMQVDNLCWSCWYQQDKRRKQYIEIFKFCRQLFIKMLPEHAKNPEVRRFLLEDEHDQRLFPYS